MDLRQKLEEAKANLAECEAALVELEAQHKEQIKSQKAIIYVARKTCRAYQDLIDKANELDAGAAKES